MSASEELCLEYWGTDFVVNRGCRPEQQPPPERRVVEIDLVGDDQDPQKCPENP